MENKEKRKTIRTFAFASFLNDLGSDMIYPVWPLFVTSVLGANMAILGFIDGLGEALVSISQAVSGYISDRIKRKKIFIWTGYLLGSVSRIGYGLSTAWQHLIPFRVIDRTGKIRSAPRDAIVADISTNAERGRNFGLLRAMDHLGAVCGILLCIFLFSLIGYRKLFILAGIPSLISALLILSFIKERKKTKIKVYKGLRLKDLNTNFKLFLFLSSIFALGSFSYSFLLIFAKEFGFKITFVPVLYLIFTGIASLFSFPFGRLSDKIGRKKTIFLAFFLWGLVCLSFIIFQNYWAIILTFILYGLHRGALEPVQRTFVSELAPAKYRASCLGGFQMVVGLCALPSSLIAGILWDKISLFMPFYFSLFLTILSIVLLAYVKE
jgi:MFS family permease